MYNPWISLPNSHITAFMAGIVIGYGAMLVKPRVTRFSSINFRKALSTVTTSKADQNAKFIHECRDLISARTPLNPHPTDDEICAARTEANKGVARVFGLENSFTAHHHSGTRANFTKLTKRGMRKIDWESVTQVAKTAIGTELGNAAALARAGETSIEVPLAPLVRRFTFKMALTAVLQKELAQLNDAKQIETATHEINRLWIEIKNADDVMKLKPFAEQTVLRSALSSIFPDVNLDDKAKNPMNLIIPSFEAMWRVAMLGFLSCQVSHFPCLNSSVLTRRPQHHVFGPAHAADAKAETFDPCAAAIRYFLHDASQPFARPFDPHRNTDVPYGARMHFNAYALALETLRLYPSSKSIYRSLRSPSSPHKPAIHRVPVNRLHTLRDGVWYDNDLVDKSGKIVPPERFWPRRWMRPQGALARLAYVPWAAGEGYWPSREGFERKMVAVRGGHGRGGGGGVRGYRFSRRGGDGAGAAERAGGGRGVRLEAAGGGREGKWGEGGVRRGGRRQGVECQGGCCP